MSVEFVQGRPGADMDRYLDQAAAAGVAEDPLARVLVVTPRQSTYGTEIEIQNVLGTPGHIGLEVVCMEDIASEILENVYGGALEFVNVAGKSMLIRGILDQRREDLMAFRSIASAADLPAALAAQIMRLRQMNISAEELGEYAAEHPEKLRIRDIALVYEELEERMAGRVDSEGALELAIAHMPEAWFLEDALVILRGFDEWSAQQIRFAEALVHQAGRVVIELPGVGDGEPDKALYGAGESAKARLLGVAVGQLTTRTIESGPPDDIVRVACELFSHQHFEPLRGDAVEISAHADAEAEVRSVAAEIVRLHEEEGVAFGDMAIIWGETTEYEPLIRRVFSEAHIPYFTGERKTLADSNIAEFVLTACELLSGPLRKEAVLAHAATGFTDLSTEEVGLLINYVRMMVSWGRELEKEFRPRKGRSFRDDARRAELARRRLMDPILQELRPKGQRNHFEALEAYLAGRLSEEKVADKAADMETDYEQVSFMQQSMEAILDLIRQAGQLLSPDIDGSELRRVLRAGFEAVELSLVPAALDEVLAGSLMATYVPPVSHLFFVGANDEVLPRFGDPGGDLLTTEEWSGLVEGLRGFRPQTSADAQKYRIVRTMMQARGRVHWSYNYGGETKPSVVIEYLRRLYRSDSGGEDGEVPPEVVRERSLRLKQNAYEEVVASVRAAADGAQTEVDPELAAAVLFDPDFTLRTEQLRESLTLANEAVPSAPLHPGRSFSATRLQTYGACPYKHFVRYQLHAWTPPDAVIDNAAAGSFLHEVLNRVARNTDERWSDESQEDFLRKIKDAAEAVRAEQIGEDPHPRNWARLDAVEPRLRDAALAMRAQQAAGALRPLASEMPFSVPLGAGYFIQGVIDRIDAGQLPEARYLSLVDYKSSARDFDLKQMLLGTDVQLVIYLLALDQLIRSGVGTQAAHLQVTDRIAGGGFLNLLPQLEAKPADIEAAYRVAGILAVPPDTAEVLYGRDGSRLVGFGQTMLKEGGYRGTSRIFAPPAEGSPNDSLEALLGCGRQVLTKAAAGCVAGNNAISPARTGALACAYCEYRSICRFEPAEQPQAVRRVSPQSSSSLREQIIGPQSSEAEEES